MSGKILFKPQKGYLLAIIDDTLITPERAHDILDAIGEQCDKTGFNQVLLDERCVERREMPRLDIMKLGKAFPDKALDKVKIAFLCRKELIDEDAKLLRTFSFSREYLIQHFSDENLALQWLKNETPTDPTSLYSLT